MRKVLTLLLCFCFFLANGQNEYKVRRGFKIDRRAPIYNIHVDDKGLKWVADEQGLVLVQSANFADPVAPRARQLVPAHRTGWQLRTEYP